MQEAKGIIEWILKEIKQNPTGLTFEEICEVMAEHNFEIDETEVALNQLYHKLKVERFTTIIERYNTPAQKETRWQLITDK